jgi:hypothetical protein
VTHWTLCPAVRRCHSAYGVNPNGGGLACAGRLWSGDAGHPSRTNTGASTGELRRLHVTVSRRFLAKLAAAREALSHSHPDGGAEAVLEAALDLLLAAQDRRRGLVKKPRKSPARPSLRPRHIPAEVTAGAIHRRGV